MPLFMDFHKFEGLEGLTIDAIKEAHTADIAIQDKYNVRYHQFWVNVEAGTAFCLTEGPDKETCEKVHQTAHGNIACAMTEVEPGFYKTMMGEGHKVDHGMVMNEDGSVDLGYRNILVARVHDIIISHNFDKFNHLQILQEARKSISDTITSFNGRETKWATDDCLIGIFNSSESAVQCALDIQRKFLDSQTKDDRMIIRIGISADQPVTKDGEFFSETIKVAHCLSAIVQENHIMISSLVKKLCRDEILIYQNGYYLKYLKETDETFVTDFLAIIDKKIANNNFTIDVLTQDLGLSRAQLYRKIVSLAGRSPNDLIRDLKMDKAMGLLKNKTHNISEAAIAVGYNNVSYFSKCFSEKFGCSPSEFISRF